MFKINNSNKSILNILISVMYISFIFSLFYMIVYIYNNHISDFRIYILSVISIIYLGTFMFLFIDFINSLINLYLFKKILNKFKECPSNSNSLLILNFMFLYDDFDDFFDSYFVEKELKKIYNVCIKSDRIYYLSKREWAKFVKNKNII